MSRRYRPGLRPLLVPEPASPAFHRGDPCADSFATEVSS